MNDDALLLRRYVEEGSESAFAELVDRHLALVYAAALRRTAGRADLAEDVAQQVFTSLARNARMLMSHPALAAWLHTATRNAALNLMKAEQRRRDREQAAATDPSHQPACSPAWDQVRPFLDEAIDQLAEPDRIAIVQRFLEQRDFASLGATFRTSPDAARMRTERALEKLRRVLERRGVKSTASALGTILGQQALTAAPTGLAAGITASAVSAAPASGLGAFASTLLMSKLTTTAAIVAGAGLTTVAWQLTTSAPGAEELAALHAEHARLLTATAEDAAAAAAQLDSRATELSRFVTDRHTRTQRLVTPSGPASSADNAGAVQRSSRSDAGSDVVTSSGHRNRGQATPRDAQLTFAWATDVAEIDVLKNLIWFDEPARTAATEILAGMPPAMRAAYPTPEALYALFISAQTQLGPPPGPDWFARLEPVEIAPGRAGFRRPGSNQLDFWQYQQTPDGWKAVLPAEVIPIIARTVLSEDFMAQLAAVQP